MRKKPAWGACSAPGTESGVAPPHPTPSLRRPLRHAPRKAQDSVFAPSPPAPPAVPFRRPTGSILGAHPRPSGGLPRREEVGRGWDGDTRAPEQQRWDRPWLSRHPINELASSALKSHADHTLSLRAREAGFPAVLPLLEMRATCSRICGPPGGGSGGFQGHPSGFPPGPCFLPGVSWDRHLSPACRVWAHLHLLWSPWSPPTPVQTP